MTVVKDTPLLAISNDLNERVRAFAESGSDEDRAAAVAGAKAVLAAVSTPAELMMNYTLDMIDMVVLFQFQEWKVFDLIPDTGSISYADLSNALGAEEALIRRFCGVLVASEHLAYAGPDHVAHSATSLLFKSDSSLGAVYRCSFFHNVIPGAHWTDYFKEFGMKEPRHQHHTPMSYAYHMTEKTTWEVIASNPDRQNAFNMMISSQDHAKGQYGSGVHVYDFGWLQDVAKENDSTTPLLVDVGGHMGKTTVSILQRYPGIPATRCVVQDLPAVIEAAKESRGPELADVTLQSHDFFTPQPVAGAMVYLLSRVIHDYWDDNCVTILSNLAAALPKDPRARIVVVDQILLDPPTRRNAYVDMIMLGVGGKERSRVMFEKLAERAGLKVVNVYQGENQDSGAVEMALI